jgi:hypothetical protein
LSKNMSFWATGVTASHAHRTVTNLIRSQAHGDNINATMLLGDAITNLVFVKVRSPWLILLILETVFAAAFLMTSIIMSQGRNHLYKSSILALLFHGLSGWTELELMVQGLEVPENLQKQAKTMKAMLKRDDEGTLKLVRS